MNRYELLRNLHAAGINPFTAYRAEEHPLPSRFPVFVRYEKDHLTPISDLLPDQAALNAKLSSLREQGDSAARIDRRRVCQRTDPTGRMEKIRHVPGWRRRVRRPCSRGRSLVSQIWQDRPRNRCDV